MTLKTMTKEALQAETTGLQNAAESCTKHKAACKGKYAVK